MSAKRVVEYHITRLKHKRHDVRLEAIHELVLLDAIDALEELETVYTTDENKEVRRAAKNAGKKLYALQLLQNQNDL